MDDQQNICHYDIAKISLFNPAKYHQSINYDNQIQPWQTTIQKFKPSANTHVLSKKNVNPQIMSRTQNFSSFVRQPKLHQQQLSYNKLPEKNTNEQYHPLQKILKRIDIKMQPKKEVVKSALLTSKFPVPRFRTEGNQIKLNHKYKFKSEIKNLDIRLISSQNIEKSHTINIIKGNKKSDWVQRRKRILEDLPINLRYLIEHSKQSSQISKLRKSRKRHSIMVKGSNCCSSIQRIKQIIF